MRLHKCGGESLITFASFNKSIRLVLSFLSYLKLCQENKVRQIDFLSVEKVKNNWIISGKKNQEKIQTIKKYFRQNDRLWVGSGKQGLRIMAYFSYIESFESFSHFFHSPENK